MAAYYMKTVSNEDAQSFVNSISQLSDSGKYSTQFNASTIAYRLYKRIMYRRDTSII
jgi:hypothetical protein